MISRAAKVLSKYISIHDSEHMLAPSSLHMAVVYGDLDHVAKYLTRKNVNKEGAWDWRNKDEIAKTATPIFCACTRGREDVLPLLIKAGADVNKPNLKGWTPLHEACLYDGSESKASEMVRILLASGANVNATDNDGFTPLALLCQNMSTIRSDEIFKVLIEAGANVDAVTSIRYSFPKTLPYKLHHKYCFPPDEKPYFLSLWDKPKDLKAEPSTPLICACYFGRYDLVQLFIAAGADVNLPNVLHDGWTPLHEACEHRGPDVLKMIKLLLNSGAQLNKTDHRGVTPLLAACINRYRKKHSIVKMLLKSGADVNAPTPSCRYLANPGLNLEYRFCNQGLLHFAIGNSTAAVKLLIQSGVDIDARCWRGRTPAFFAVQCRNIGALSILLKAGADVNIANNRGLTPLHEAIRLLGDNTETSVDFAFTQPYVTQPKVITCVAIILDSGADLNPVDGEGLTPLQYANSYTHLTVVDFLLDHGAGIDVKCQRIFCPCNSTVTICHYLRNKLLFQLTYWKFYWKMTSVRLNLGIRFLPFRVVKAWNSSTVYKFVNKHKNPLNFSVRLLEGQLCGIMFDTLGNTETTCNDVLVHHPPAIKSPLMKQLLTKEFCCKQYPVYGELIYARYVRGLKRFDLIEQCVQFFSLLEPSLNDECASEVLGYLREQDLLNIISIINAIRA